MGEERLQRGNQFHRRGRWRFHRLAQRPGMAGAGQLPFDRLCIEGRHRVLAQQYGAVVLARDRRTNDGMVERRIVPGDGDAAIEIVGLDADRAGALRRQQTRLVAGAGTLAQPPRHRDRTPAEMLLRGLAIESGDIQHVGEALGGEVHRALAQCARGSVIDNRIRRAIAERLRRAIENRLDRDGGRLGPVAHFAISGARAAAIVSK